MLRASDPCDPAKVELDKSGPCFWADLKGRDRPPRPQGLLRPRDSTHLYGGYCISKGSMGLCKTRAKELGGVFSLETACRGCTSKKAVISGVSFVTDDVTTGSG